MATVNHVLRPFKGNTNFTDSQGLKHYLQETRETEKEADNLDISVFNT